MIRVRAAFVELEGDPMPRSFALTAVVGAVFVTAGMLASTAVADPAASIIRIADPDPYSPGYRRIPEPREIERRDDYRPPARDDYVAPSRRAYEPEPRYEAPAYRAPRRAEPYDPDYGGDRRARYEREDYDDRRYSEPPETTYSENELVDAGHRFFGSVSKGLAKAIQYVFKRSGRPNGYILGEDAGGAFVAGLRYGEGRLYTKTHATRRVYWQGPSLGYDFGGEGSKVMTLVYNLRSPNGIFKRFGGVQGSAYLVGGVSVQFQKRGRVVLAPIRAGVGLRLGANVGYLKYTRRPTWNPF